MNRAANAFRASHPNLNLLERGLSRASRVAHTFQNILNTFNLFRIAQGTSDTNTQLEIMKRRADEARREWESLAGQLQAGVPGVTTKMVLEAELKFRDLESNIKDMQDRVNQEKIQIPLQFTIAGIQLGAAALDLARLAALKPDLSNKIVGALGSLKVSVPVAITVAVGTALLTSGKGPKELMSELVEGWRGQFEETRKWFEDQGKSLGDALWTGITGAQQWIADNLSRSFEGLSEKMFSAGADLASQLAQGFGHAVQFLKSVGNSIISVLNRVIEAVNRIEINIPPIFDPFFGFLIHPGFNWRAVSIPSIPFLAHGTSDFSGGPAVVGEHGPELAFLPQHTRVSPFGAASPQINIYVQGSIISENELLRTVRRGLKSDASRLFS